MHLEIKNKYTLNSKQYIMFEWLDVAFFHTQILEKSLETESLSLK